MKKSDLLKFISFSIVYVVIASCIGSTATDKAEDPDHSTEIGINIGNPPAPKNTLAFNIVNELAPQLKDCLTVQSERVLSQKCPIAADSISMRIMHIDVLDCLGASGEHLACNDPATVSIGSRYTIYSGDPIVVNVTTDIMDFPGALDSIPDGVIGGLQFVTSYVQVALPDSGTPETTRIIEEMIGDNIRVCTSMQTVNDNLEDCGHSDAKLWHLLADKDDDGIFKFMFEYDHSTLFSYFANMSKQIADTAANNLIADSTMTDGEYYDKGYFAPIVSLDAPVNISGSFNLTITMDTSHTLTFMDGGIDNTPRRQVCVGALFPKECKALGIDSDPNTVGIYSPMADGHPSIYFPEIKLVDSE